MLNSNFNLRTFLTESKAPKQQVEEAMLSEATVMEYIRERMSSMNNEVRTCMREYLSTVSDIDTESEDAHAQLMNALEDFYNKLKDHFEADAPPMGAPGEDTMDTPEVAPTAGPALTLEEEDEAFGGEEDDREDDELSPEELANKHAGSPMKEASVEFHQNGKKTFEKEFDTEEEADVYKAKAADMADTHGVELKEYTEEEMAAITANAIEADKEQFEKETSEDVYEAEVNEALDPDTLSLLLGLAKTAVSAGTVPAALAILYQYKDNPKIAKAVAAFEKHLDK